MSEKRGPRRRRVFRLPFSRRAVRAAVEDELRFHIEGRIEELMANGMERAQAEREARARFGDVARIGSELETIDRVQQRRRNWRENIAAAAQDARLAMRGMARRPLHTAIVVLTLALGIGANTAIFSAVDAVLLRPVPTPDIGRLVTLRADLMGMNLLDAELSPGEALDVFARHDLFQSSAAYTGGSMNLTGSCAPGEASCEPRRVEGARTMGEFFTLFGVRPLLGRLYRPEDSVEGAPRVVVLTHTLWRQLAAGDTGFVGRFVELNGTRYQVIGVLPSGFRLPRTAELYTPFVLTQRAISPEQRHSLYMTVVARLRPGLSREQLAGQLRAEARRWDERLGGYGEKGFALRAVPFVDYVSGDLGPILRVLTAAVALVLLIACANVASLQLVRAAGRAKEIAVRAALGAGRATIARQLLVESVVLALVGGVLGVGIGQVIVRAIASLNVGPYAVLRDVRLDARVLAFTALLAMLSGVVFGLFPALRASKVDLHDVLKDAPRGSSVGVGRHRALHGSVVLQVALSLVLLLASVSTARSLARLLRVDPGFRPAELMTMRVSLPYTRYNSNPARVGFYDALLERLRATPGVMSAGLVSYVPFGGGLDSSPFDIPSRPATPNGPAYHANTEVIAGDYFRAMGIPLLRGRTFEASDAGGASVVVIDEYLAQTYFGGEDPVGKQIRHNELATIIGVVGNVTPGELGAPAHATVYHPYVQNPWLNFTTVVIRSALREDAVTARARAAVRDLDASLPLYDVQPMRDRIAGSVAPKRLATLVLSGFAGLSLVLALLGIYGVISYSTAQRTQEIGIRLALGANPHAVTFMVLRHGLVLALIGLAAGLVIFLGVGRVVESLLFGVSPRDPLTILGSIAALSAVALLASYLPARRAARVDPLAALRSE